MRLDNPVFAIASTTEGIHTCEGVRTPTGAGANVFADDGTLIPVSSLGGGGTTETLQTVTNRGNTTTQDLISTSHVQARASASQFTSIYPSYISGQFNNLYRGLISWTGAYIYMTKNSTSYTRIDFPTASQNNIINLPNKSGTFALLDDITSVSDTNDYVNSVSFNSTDGVLTLGRTGALANLTTSLDGRYLQTNQTINLGGDLTGAGSTSIIATLTAFAITGKTALTSGLVSTDELLVSDNGTLKKMDVSVLEAYMQDNLDFTGGGGDGNNYPTSLSFDTGNGVLTMGRNGLSNLIVDLDGRYAQANNFVESAAFATSTGVLTLNRSGLSAVTVDLDGRYLQSNQSISLSGDASGSGTTSIAMTLTTNAITGKTALTSGLTSVDELLVYDSSGTALKRMDISVLQDYMEANLDTGTPPVRITDTSYSNKLSTITIVKFRVSKFGNMVTMNLKLTGTSGGAGTRLFTITNTNFRPQETTYFTAASNQGSGSAAINYLYIDTSGNVYIDTNSDGVTQQISASVTWCRYNELG